MLHLLGRRYKASVQRGSSANSSMISLPSSRMPSIAGHFLASLLAQRLEHLLDAAYLCSRLSEVLFERGAQVSLVAVFAILGRAFTNCFST